MSKRRSWVEEVLVQLEPYMLLCALGALALWHRVKFATVDRDTDYTELSPYFHVLRRLSPRRSFSENSGSISAAHTDCVLSGENMPSFEVTGSPFHYR